MFTCTRRSKSRLYSRWARRTHASSTGTPFTGYIGQRRQQARRAHVQNVAINDDPPLTLPPLRALLPSLRPLRPTGGGTSWISASWCRCERGNSFSPSELIYARTDGQNRIHYCPSRTSSCATRRRAAAAPATAAAAAARGVAPRFKSRVTHGGPQ